MPDADMEFMVLWDHFCAANVFSTQGGQWLDALLCYLLYREQRGDEPVSIIPGRCVSRLVQGLIYQFQRDVHEACSVQLRGVGGGGGGERPDSELAAVLQYMVAGRGWMILHVINALPSTWLRISPETVELLCSLMAPLVNHSRLVLELVSKEKELKEKDEEKTEESQKKEKAEESQESQGAQKTKESPKECQESQGVLKTKESLRGSLESRGANKTQESKKSQGSPESRESQKPQESRGAEGSDKSVSPQESLESQEADESLDLQQAQEPEELLDAPCDGLYPLPIDWETASVHGTPYCLHTEQLLAGRRPASEPCRAASPEGSSDDESESRGLGAADRLHPRPPLVVSRRAEADCWDYLSVAGAASGDERPAWVAQPHAERPSDWTERYRPQLMRRRLTPDAAIRLSLSLLTRCCLRATPGVADPRCAVCLRACLRLVDARKVRSLVPEHALLLAAVSAGPTLVTGADVIAPNLEAFAAAELASSETPLSGRALLVAVRCIALMAYQSVKSPAEAAGGWPETLALWRKLQLTEALQRFLAEPTAEPELCRALAASLASAVIALKELRAPPPVAGSRRRAADGCGGGPLSPHHQLTQPVGLAGCPAAFLSEQLLRLPAAAAEPALQARLGLTAEQSGVCCCLPPAVALPLLTRAVDAAGSASGCRLALRLLETTLAQLGGTASSVDCRVCDLDRGPADGGRWLPAAPLYGRLLTADAPPRRRRLLAQHLLRVLGAAHPRLRLVLLCDLLLPLVPPADADGAVVLQGQELLISLSVSACCLVLEDRSVPASDPSVTVISRLLHPAQLTALFGRPPLRRRALTLLALLAAAETDRNLQTPSTGGSTAALMDTLLAHTGDLSRGLLAGGPGAVAGAAAGAGAAGGPPPPPAYPSKSSQPPAYSSGPARSPLSPPPLAADLPQLTDMWQAFCSAVSQWRPLGEAVLSQYPDLGRDLASALDRLLRYTGSLEEDQPGQGDAAVDTAALDACCRLLAVLLEAALLVAELADQQPELERRLTAALAELQPRSAALLTRLADLLIDRCQPTHSNNEQPDSGSEGDSAVSEGSYAPLSPTGSTDGYDADLEVTDGPAPLQSCARRRLRHVWLLPLLADLLVRSFSAGCRPHLLRCRQRDWLRHLQRWGADPAGPDPPRARFQRPAAVPRKQWTRPAPAERKETEAEVEGRKEAAGAGSRTEESGVPAAAEAEGSVEAADGSGSGTGKSSVLVDTDAVKDEARTESPDGDLRVGSEVRSETGSAAEAGADIGSVSPEDSPPVSEEQHEEETDAVTQSAPVSVSESTAEDDGDIQPGSAVSHSRVDSIDPDVIQAEPVTKPTDLADPLPPCSQSEDSVDRAEPAIDAELLYPPVDADLARPDPCEFVAPAADNVAAEVEAGTRARSESLAETEEKRQLLPAETDDTSVIGQESSAAPAPSGDVIGRPVSEDVNQSSEEVTSSRAADNSAPCKDAAKPVQSKSVRLEPESAPGRDPNSMSSPGPESAPELAPHPDPALEPEPESVRQFGRGLRHAAARLAAAVRQSEAVATQLRRIALPALLLNGMPELFSTALPAVEDAVRACADLTWSVHADSVTADVLKQYAGFLTAPNPPVMSLLWPLPRLFESPPAPIHSLQFPAGAAVEPAERVGAGADGAADGMADVLKMQRVHRDRRVGSSLALSAAAIPLGCLRRPLDPFAGCSVSLWLRAVPSSAPASSFSSSSTSSPSSSPAAAAAAARSDVKPAAAERSRCHVLSVGAAGQLTELWLERERRLLVRRTESSPMTCRVLCEAPLSARLTDGRWTHLALRLVPSGEVMTLTVIVDGSISESLDVPSATCTGAAVLLLGHGGAGGAAGDGDGSATYELSSVLSFSEPVLDLEQAFILRLLGPNCTDLTACSFTPLKVNISDSLTPTVLKKVNIARIASSFGDMAKKLEPALLLSYSTAEPAVALTYPEPGVVPEATPVTWRCTARHQLTPRLVSAVTQLGGLKFFMYLFARVVELDADGVSQATALHVLLSAASHQWRWTSDEAEDLLPHMVADVLASKHAVVGGHMLQAYLSACVGGITLQLRAPDALAGVGMSDPVVRSPSLLVGLFRHWRCWLEPEADHSEFSGRCRLLSEAVRTVVLVLSERFKYRSFNLAALREKRLLEEVLEFVTSHYVDDLGDPLPALMVENMMLLIQSFVGTPPGVSVVTALWRTVLLLHPARSLFVCQTRSSCYYLLDSALIHTRHLAAASEARWAGSAAGSSVRRSPAREALSTHSSQPSQPTRPAPPVPPAGSDMTDGKQELVSRFLDSLPPQRSARARTVSPERPSATAAPAVRRRRSGSSSTCEEAALPASLPASSVPAGETPSGPRSPLLQLALRMRGESEASETTSEPQSVGERADVSCGQFAARLMGLVTSALSACPEQDVPAVWAEVRAEHLCVLANHDEPTVRAAVVKLLKVWCQRAPAPAIHQFTRDCGFHLLGNQLHVHPATSALLEASRRLVLSAPPGRDPIQQVQRGALTLLLALLPASTADISLCHNIITHLENIVNKVEHWIGSLLDDGLVESVCGATLRLAHLPLQLTDLGTSQRQILYDDVTRLLTSLARRLVLSTQQKHFQVLYDLLIVLNYLYEEEHRQCGAGSTPTVTVVRLQFDVVETALSTILDSVNQLSLDSSRPRQALPSRWDLSERHRRILLLAVDIITYLDPGDVTEHTVHFLEWLLPMMTICVQNPMVEGRTEGLRQPRPSLKTALGTLLVTLSSPDWPSDVRVFVAVFLAQMDTQVDAVLQAALLTTTSKAYQFSLFFHELMYSSDRSSDPASAVESNSGSINSAPEDHSQPLADTAAAPAAAALLATGSSSSTSVTIPAAAAPAAASVSTASGSTASSAAETDPALPGPAPSERRSRLSERLGSVATSGRYGALSVVAEALERNGLPSPPPPPKEKGAQWTVVENTIKLWRQDRAERRRDWRKNLVAAEKKAMQCFETHYHRVCEAAHRATEVTTGHQNEARRAHLQVLRASAMLDSRVESAWRQVIKQMADEGAPWAPPQAQHSFWELDPTEGYLRQRNRLRKTKLNLASRFFKQNVAPCLESDRLPAPLSYLLSSGAAEVSSQYIEQFHTDRVRYMTPCEVIVLDGGVPGEILISDSSLYFVVDRTAVADSSTASLVLGSSDSGYQRWPCEDIRELHRRRFELRECAVELFMSTGRTHLITFTSTEVRERFLTEVFSCPSLQLMDGDSLADLTQRWRDGSLTNFEYLMHLNKMAGRTFNDLMQYPVFPFVVRDYSSDGLDLADPAVYRDLRRPMGVQDATREAYYVERYKYLQSEMFGSPERLGIDGPYHYGTHYSNSGIVLHFLVRMPPFTKLFLKFQDGNFDLPDRTFHSVEQVWRLSSSASNTDFKELIPEFYFLHELFTNSQGFQIGRRQSGQPVDSVILPDWCQHSARLFVLVLRQALESEAVRHELPHWIDLVFGFKQTGQPAVQAVNVFHPATYVGYDVHRYEDAMARQARLTMVRTYGQMPRKLFRSSHPHVTDRPPARRETQPPLLPTVSGLRWGDYVGSPESAIPGVVWQRPLTSAVCRLELVPTSAVLTVPPHTCCAQQWRQTRRHVFSPPPPADQLSWVNWGQPDGLVRLRRAQQTQAIVAPPPGDQVDMCTFSAGRLWVALQSGTLHVYDTRPVTAAAGVRLVRLGLGRLAALELCSNFSVIVAADRDGNLAIWDTNTLELVRRFSVAGSVHALAVSPTAGDMIVAYGEQDAPPAAASTLELITINGRTAAHRGCPLKVTAVTVSALTEGRAVNVVAAGHEDGTVTLWDTWLLRPVGEPLLPPPAAAKLPVTSLCYSHAGRLLHVLHGRVPSAPQQQQQVQQQQQQVLVLWTSGGVKPAARAARLLDLAAERPRHLPAWSSRHQHTEE